VARKRLVPVADHEHPDSEEQESANYEQADTYVFLFHVSVTP
jgi:hypothetical protein